MRYNTKQRELILKYLSESEGKHIKADEILEYLKKNDTPVGKSTVYRYLDNLMEQNLIRKYTVEDGQGACYQYLGSEGHNHCKEHYHLKCSKCGELFHVSCEFMDEISAHILEHHGFTVDNSKTVFYGICKKCKLQIV
ncbi:MAG: transcriptional repressor [Lachnospiraceae bacterium]|nr:transcriptional repressor [Lachnospiraceae bacterium]